VIENIIQRRKDKDTAKKQNSKDEILQQQESVAKMFEGEDGDEFEDTIDQRDSERSQTNQHSHEEKRDTGGTLNISFT
jgi:hypothetical protein